MFLKFHKAAKKRFPNKNLKSSRFYKINIESFNNPKVKDYGKLIGFKEFDVCIQFCISTHKVNNIIF